MSPLVSSTRFLQTQPDARLVALARAGYERAFEALVNRYRRQLLAYCRRLIASESSAEDVLQQALLQAWVAIRSDAEVRDIRPWLYRIVHNVAISTMRRPQADVIELQTGEGAGGADHVAEQRLAARQALAGLAALPDLQREVMLGTAIHGRSHDELAAALGLSNGAIRGLIYRARATLRAAAAVIIPGPLVNSAARHGGVGGGSGGLAEALAGGGSAGLGGVFLKGGAVLASAGALATAAGITIHHHAHHTQPHARAARPSVATRAAAPTHTPAILVSDRASGAGAVSGRRSSRAVRGREGGGGHGASRGSGSRRGTAGSPSGRSSGGLGRSPGGGGGPGESSHGPSGSGRSPSAGGSDGGGSGGRGGGSSSGGGDHHGDGGSGSGSGSSGSGSGSRSGSRGGDSGSGSGSGSSGSGSGSGGRGVSQDDGVSSGDGTDGGSGSDDGDTTTTSSGVLAPGSDAGDTTTTSSGVLAPNSNG